MSEICGNDGPMSIPKSRFLPTKSKRPNLQRKYREIYPAMISFDSPRISICHYQIIPSAAQIPKVAISKNSKTATKFDGIPHGISSCSSILTIRDFTFYGLKGSIFRVTYTHLGQSQTTIPVKL